MTASLMEPSDRGPIPPLCVSVTTASHHYCMVCHILTLGVRCKITELQNRDTAFLLMYKLHSPRILILLLVWHNLHQ